MTQLTHIFLLLSLSTFAKANTVEDSLIANIGKKAKVIFYAEKKADLDEIAKYDLNKLFAEVRKRSEKNFSNTEEVTLREVDENLKNRQANTTVSSKKWFKNMNLNLFVGGSGINTNFASFLGNDVANNSNSNVYYKNIFKVKGSNSFMVGIGGFYYKKLLTKKHSEFSLGYGAGFDLINSQIQILKTGSIGYSTPLTSTNSYYPANYGSSKINLLSTNLYIQVMPTINLVNRRDEKTFNFGIGVKLFSNFNGMNPVPKNPIHVDDSPYIYVKNNSFQTAFIANIGYKHINAFMQLTPKSTTLRTTINTDPSTLFNNYRQIDASIFTFGLRFGK